MVPFLTAKVNTIDTIVVRTEKEALLLENTLIKRHQPQYNAVLKDDKTFVSLMINDKHPWPQVRLVRYKGKPSKKGTLFRPLHKRPRRPADLRSYHPPVSAAPMLR